MKKLFTLIDIVTKYVIGNKTKLLYPFELSIVVFSQP